MIYFFDNELNMIKVATSKNVISAVHEHELNGLILGTIEADLSYTEAFINDVDYFGYYYKDNYHLHKIKRVEHEHENELVRITGRHIFFEDMLYGDYIRDVRPVNRDALYILNQTISANTRWQTVMTDTSKLHSETYYWVPPMEVLNDLTENIGIEYEPRILFDGQKINGFQLHVANRIGEDTPIRVPFGSRVLNLKYEVDYSEIVTALYGHGKGEEVGDGYGRRINFSSVNFSRNGVVSPSGQLYMENSNVTAQYGKDDGSPKFGRIIFEDIESAPELANATYEAYLEQSRPKMLFEASVVDLGDVGMGDGVLIIRREYDVYFNARIHKLMVDLLDAENADVELGDYAHFKESKVQRKTRESNNQYRRETSSRIQQLKEQFNDRFDGEVNQMREDFEQALIDAHAEIQAAEERMEALITTTRNDWTDTFEAGVAEIYRKADEDYNRIETEITGVIDSTRNEMESEFNSIVNDARTYAEQQAQEKANAVRTDLETVTSGHQNMLDDLETNVMNIDDFIGANRNITLDQRLLDMTQDFDQRIRNSSRDASNMLRGSRFDEPDMINPHFGGVSLHTTEHENFIRLNTIQSNIPLVIMNGELHLHEGVEYHLHIEYRTDTVTELDGFVFYHNNGTTERLENRGLTITGLTTSGAWEHASMTLTPNAEMSGRLAIGTRGAYGTSPDGTIDVRLPYLTTTAHDQWLPHPRDENQNITEISRRITDLEDGYSDFIVRSVWDAEMHSMTQTIRDYQTTVDGVEDTIIQLENSELITRGREVLDAVDGFQRKVWLGDVDRPNLIPHAVFKSSEARDEWYEWGFSNQQKYGGRFNDYAIVGNRNSSSDIGIVSPEIGEYVIPGEQYTLSWEASTHYPSTTDIAFNYMYILNVGDNNTSYRLDAPEHEIVGTGYNAVYRKYQLTFIMPDNIKPESRILFGTHTVASGIDAFFRFRHPKLETGTIASPFKTAYSMLEQRADTITLQVDDQESRISNFTVDLDGIAGTVADIEGDMVKQSSLEITPDYAQIGSMRIDGDTVGSLLRVSPSGIDAVAEAMRLSGDLYVDGDITTIAVDAIEGEFARLWADEFSAITIDVDDISGLTARFEYLYTLNANIERLVSQQVFANGVNALVGNFVDVNAGNIVTSGLSANVIKSSHLDVDTTMVRKLFATSARIDQLITRHHYVDNVKALSIDAVYADISNLRTKLLTSDVILSRHVNASMALIDKIFSEEAYIERLTSKSAFIRDIQAIEITANQLNINTLQNKLGSVEGGLHIYGPDGRVLINNSILQASFDVQIRPNHASSAVSTTGLNFVTNSDSWQTFEHFYTDHKGSQLLVSWALSLQSGNSGSEYIEVRTRGFGGYNPIGTQPLRRTVTTSGTTYYNQIIDLGVPNYSGIQGYLEFRRDPNGTSTSNNVMARVLRVSLIN